MECNGCGNKDAHRVSYSSSGETCNACGSSGTFRFSDVFFKEPYFDSHIAHPEKAPFGTQIRSREHKASMMREYGLKEAGDRKHGTRVQY